MQMQPGVCTYVRMATLAACFDLRCNERFLSKSRCVSIVMSGMTLPKMKKSTMANAIPAIPPPPPLHVYKANKEQCPAGVCVRMCVCICVCMCVCVCMRACELRF